MVKSPTQSIFGRKAFAAKAICFEAGLLFLAIGIGYLVGFSPLNRISGTELPRQVLVGVLAAVPMLVGLLLLQRASFSWLQRIETLLDDTILPLFQQLNVFELALLSLAAGVGEEVLFRGLLQDGISQVIGGVNGQLFGLFSASLIFGLVHWLTRAYALLAAMAGVYLGLLMVVTDSLMPPIVAHAAYDFIALLVLLRFGRSRTQAS